MKADETCVYLVRPGQTIAVLAGKGMTGTAWFDDASVRQIRRDPMKTVLKKPNYREEIHVGPDAGIMVKPG